MKRVILTLMLTCLAFTPAMSQTDAPAPDVHSITVAEARDYYMWIKVRLVPGENKLAIYPPGAEIIRAIATDNPNDVPDGIEPRIPECRTKCLYGWTFDAAPGLAGFRVRLYTPNDNPATPEFEWKLFQTAWVGPTVRAVDLFDLFMLADGLYGVRTVAVNSANRASDATHVGAFQVRRGLGAGALPMPKTQPVVGE